MKKVVVFLLVLFTASLFAAAAAANAQGKTETGNIITRSQIASLKDSELDTINVKKRQSI